MKIGNFTFDLVNKAYIMGILNVTPDSFSDGGKYTQIEHAISRAQQMVAEGASIIDIGGESTRPGHEIISSKEEIARVVPVITELVKRMQVPISIDTSKGDVAKAAIMAGATMINDIWGFKKDPSLAFIAKEYNVPVCLMHNRDHHMNNIQTHNNQTYNDLIPDMIEDLYESIVIAQKAGIDQDKIILDPGIGFAKSFEDNLKVMKHLEAFSGLNYPILLGTSRKSMIGLTLDLPSNERIEGTIATTVLGYTKGCRIFRVHDVKENYRALKMTEAILAIQ